MPRAAPAHCCHLRAQATALSSLQSVSRTAPVHSRAQPPGDQGGLVPCVAHQPHCIVLRHIHLTILFNAIIHHAVPDDLVPCYSGSVTNPAPPFPQFAKK